MDKWMSKNNPRSSSTQVSEEYRARVLDDCPLQQSSREVAQITSLNNTMLISSSNETSTCLGKVEVCGDVGLCLLKHKRYNNSTLT
jgi:hypothetical protein